MWNRLRRSRAFWTILAVLFVAYIGRARQRARDERERDRAARQLSGVADLLVRTGRSVADGTMRMMRR